MIDGIYRLINQSRIHKFNQNRRLINKLLVSIQRTEKTAINGGRVLVFHMG